MVGYDDIKDSIVKEMREELVSEIKSDNIFLLVDKTKNEREDNKCFVTCFCAIINKNEKDFLRQKEEVDELKWFSFDEFCEMVKHEKGTIFKNNEYYNKIISELRNLFESSKFSQKILDLSELIEELDRYGNKTGKIVTREFAHNFGIYHQAVSLFVLNKSNQVLLQKRSKFKIRNAGLWDLSISGHVKYGEDNFDAIKREALEEANIHITQKDIEFLIKYKENRKFNNKFKDNTFFDVYVMKEPIDSDIFKEADFEVESLKWFSLEELEKMMETYSELAYKPEAFEAIIKFMKNK